MNWRDYLNCDFGTVERNEFHIDGYIYDTGNNEERPYRHVMFCGCYIPINKRGDINYYENVEEKCKQYIEDLTEEEAEEAINFYIKNYESI